MRWGKQPAVGQKLGRVLLAVGSLGLLARTPAQLVSLGKYIPIRINNKGMIAANSGGQAFLVDSHNPTGTPTSIKPLTGGATSTSATALNDLNQVVGQSGGQGFIWSLATGKTSPLGEETIANGIDSFGDAVGQRIATLEAGPAWFSIEWNANGGVSEPFGQPSAGEDDEAFDVNDSNIIVGTETPTHTDGYAYIIGASRVTLLPAGNHAVALRVTSPDHNHAAQGVKPLVIGEATGNGVEVGWVYDTGTKAVKVLPPLVADLKCAATDVNQDGVIVGWSQTKVGGSTVQHATMWTKNSSGVWVATDLNGFISTPGGGTSSTVLSTAAGINDAGMVVGATSSSQGYVLTLQGVDVSGLKGKKYPGTFIVPAKLQAAYGGSSAMSCFIAETQRGGSINLYAEQQLKAARWAGYRTAAYMYLNFTNYTDPNSGAEQMAAALLDCGSEKSNIEFMMIDLEHAYENQNNNEVNNLAILKSALSALPSNIKPVIYSSASEWEILIDTEADDDTALGVLPLWDSLYDDNSQLLYDTNKKKGTTALWSPYGPWKYRVGKQWDQDATVPETAIEAALNYAVDVDTFGVGLWPNQGIPPLDNFVYLYTSAVGGSKFDTAGNFQMAVPIFNYGSENCTNGKVVAATLTTYGALGGIESVDASSLTAIPEIDAFAKSGVTQLLEFPPGIVPGAEQGMALTLTMAGGSPSTQTSWAVLFTYSGPTLKSVTPSSDAVAGGNPVTITLTLSGTPPNSSGVKFAVTTSDSTNAPVPSTIIMKGKTATMTINTSKPSAKETVTITFASGDQTGHCTFNLSG